MLYDILDKARSLNNVLAKTHIMRCGSRVLCEGKVVIIIMIEEKTKNGGFTLWQSFQ